MIRRESTVDRGGRVVAWAPGAGGTSAIPLAVFGPLRVPTDRLVEWVADWVSAGGRLLNKPTNFEARDGRF